MTGVGVPYASADFDEAGRYCIVCPECGERFYAEDATTVRLDAEDRLSGEDATTKSASLGYAEHYVSTHAEAGR